MMNPEGTYPLYDLYAVVVHKGDFKVITARSWEGHCLVTAPRIPPCGCRVWDMWIVCLGNPAVP